MSVFSAYAKYYNLLYKDKDYAGEARYIHELIQHIMNNISKIFALFSLKNMSFDWKEQWGTGKKTRSISCGVCMCGEIF